MFAPTLNLTLNFFMDERAIQKQTLAPSWREIELAHHRAALQEPPRSAKLAQGFICQESEQALGLPISNTCALPWFAMPKLSATGNPDGHLSRGKYFMSGI
ncbi:hypothetical protein [Paucibacter sp. KBW04]|uniref:hypothetical protein n=1 Tax=Paucibacter sp. KBW04 TaxID=2153361 RepID=UPI000F5612DD|nr:hypothetical protein [Paucibacter sp. KBW04]